MSQTQQILCSKQQELETKQATNFTKCGIILFLTSI